MYPSGNYQPHPHPLQTSTLYIDSAQTEEVILPHFSNQFLMGLYHTNSQVLSRSSEKYHSQFSSRKDPHHAKIIEKEIQKKLNIKESFTKAHIVQLNKKQRDTRKNHYRYASDLNSHSPIKDNKPDLALDFKNSRKQMKIGQKSEGIKRNIQSAFSSRSQHREAVSSSYLRSISMNSQSRPMTAFQKGNSNVLSKKEALVNNPRIIYPFETKIKIKRVDENPKILASVLSKKHKTLQRDELYSYINKLMIRRIQKS